MLKSQNPDTQICLQMFNVNLVDLVAGLVESNFYRWKWVRFVWNSGEQPLLLGVSINGESQNGWFIMENPNYWNWWFGGTPISGNLHLDVWSSISTVQWIGMINIPVYPIASSQLSHQPLRSPFGLTWCPLVIHKHVEKCEKNKKTKNIIYWVTELLWEKPFVFF
jgi:hypothetical protein